MFSCLPLFLVSAVRPPFNLYIYSDLTRVLVADWKIKIQDTRIIQNTEKYSIIHDIQDPDFVFFVSFFYFYILDFYHMN